MAAYSVATAFSATATGADFVDGAKELNRPRNGGSEAERTKDAVLQWRKAAWQEDDFLAEIQLGDVYSKDNRLGLRTGQQSAGPDFAKFYDRVEAYVWYFLAVHSERFTRYIFSGDGQIRIAALQNRAGTSAADLFLRMSEAERTEAKNRIVYVLSCRGTGGLIRLAMILNDDQGFKSDPVLASLNAQLRMIRTKVNVQDNNPLKQQSGIAAQQAFSTDKFASLMFLHVAQLRGSGIAAELFNGRIAQQTNLPKPVPDEIVAQIKDDARRWVRPFEFYPRGVAQYPHTDECLRSVEEQRKLQRIANFVDPSEIKQALWFLQFLHGDREAAADKLGRAIGDFQEALLHDRTGKLAPDEILRLLQMAAVNGHIPSQVRLGVLYARAEALRADYERAANWFVAAAKQRDGQAMYYLGEMIKKNYVTMDGSANATAAVSFYVQASLAGYGPTRDRFKDLLDAGPCESCQTPRRLPPRKNVSDPPSVSPVVRPPFDTPRAPLAPPKDPKDSGK